jgi:hypothetical protein
LRRNNECDCADWRCERQSRQRRPKWQGLDYIQVLDYLVRNTDTKQLDQLNKLGGTINGDIYCCIKTGKFCINTTFVMACQNLNRGSYSVCLLLKWWIIFIFELYETFINLCVADDNWKMFWLPHIWYIWIKWMSQWQCGHQVLWIMNTR